MFALITSKIKTWLAVAGTVILAVGLAWLKGRGAGKTAVTQEIQHETQKIDEKFQRIDAAPPSFDGAISDLRKRSLHP